jgi:hypothetical protein
MGSITCLPSGERKIGQRGESQLKIGLFGEIAVPDHRRRALNNDLGADVNTSLNADVVLTFECSKFGRRLAPGSPSPGSRHL